MTDGYTVALAHSGGMSDESERRGVAERAARAGAAVALEGFREGLPVETKADATDVVTEADRAAQRTVAAVIRESHPDDPIVGEEDGERSDVPPEGPAWIIDPIDGTNNFVREVRTFGTAVASVVDGEPVAAAIVLPALDDVYTSTLDRPERNGQVVTTSDVAEPTLATVAPTIWWSRDRRAEYAAACRTIVERFDDLRRVGCAQASLAQVADGGLDGVFTNVEANPWDTVAGVHLVRQAGGRVTDLRGDRWRHDARGLVASNGEVHDAVLTAAQETDAVRD